VASGRSSEAAKPRLILVDDHRLVVEALSASLATAFEIAGVAYAGRELLALLAHTSADCLLLDIQLPDRSGLDLIPEVLALQPDLKILIVTMFLDRALAEAALAAGAHGFMPKDAGLAELTKAITAVLAGKRHVSARVRNLDRRTNLAAAHPGLHRLTPRQQAVFRLLGEGQSAADIARQLDVSPSTITFHKQNIQTILGFDDSAALFRFAVLLRNSLKGATAEHP
jgi:DNA-binding NarL/FixJ family response regulator